jgi:hypothetical protein
MKYLKRFNESMEEQIYQQVLDSIRECFLEFEDNGWHWIINPSSVYGEEQPGISVWQNPNFNCRMMNKEESDPRNWGKNPQGRKYFIDWTGEVKSNGEIKWETKDLTDDKFKDLIDGPVLEEAENFLVAVKRLHDDTGLDFNFSYNNRGDERRIIITGRI